MTRKKLSKHTLPLGYKLKTYEIEGYLGEGGFGVTYLARHTSLQQLVAIKEYFPTQCAIREPDYTIVAKTSQDDDYTWGLERFLVEAKTLVLFKHDNITRVRDFFEENGSAYMVMDYERGETFKEWLTRLKKINKIPTENELLDIITPILNALESLHSKQHLHLDIKPSNIYICEDGRPMLIDFGTARHAFSNKSHSIRSVLSEGYAPKEQYSNRGNMDTWTDIYALSATLYCAITRFPPPPSPDRGEARDEEQPDPLVSALVLAKKMYSVPFLAAIDAGLAYLPKERPQTVAEFSDILLNKDNAGLKSSKKHLAKKTNQKAVPQKNQDDLADTTVLFNDKQYTNPKQKTPPHKNIFLTPVKIIILCTITIMVLGTAWWGINNKEVFISTDPEIPSEITEKKTENTIENVADEKNKNRLKEAALENLYRIKNDAYLYHLTKINRSKEVYQAYLNKCQICAKKSEIERSLLLANRYKRGDVWIEGNTKIKFTWIPSGTFKIGSIKSNAAKDERKGFKLDIEGFFIGVTEVTVGQFRKFVEATAYKTSRGDGCPKSGSWDRDRSGYQQEENYPVSCVSWNDAQAFIKWLNSLGEDKFTLPSEAQWEYACRAGEIREYCGSNSYPKYAWGSKNSRKRTQPVATKEFNAFGLFDMSGNLHEWTGSKYQKNYNGHDEMQSSAVATHNETLVVRGGSFKSAERSLRSTARGKIPKAAIISYDDVGFRLVRMTPL